MMDLTDDQLRSEIEVDRRRERRVLWQAALSLLLVGALVVVRLLVVGWSA